MSDRNSSIPDGVNDSILSLGEGSSQRASNQESDSFGYPNRNRNTDFSRPVYLKIRFSSGKDMDLTFNSSNLYIKEIKSQLSSKMPEVRSDQHLRLIHQGRILKDEMKLAELVSRGNSIRPVSSTSRNYGTNQEANSHFNNQAHNYDSPSSPLVLHGQILEEVVETSLEAEQSRIIPPTGFERLQEAGFSPEDIQQIRIQFHNSIEVDPNTTDPEVMERIRRLEEAWIDNATATLPDGTTEGTYNELLWGLVIGFFLGLLPIFWQYDSTFSKKNQLGILIGIMINILFGGVMLIE